MKDQLNWLIDSGKTEQTDNMTQTNRFTNRALLNYVALPMLFLTVVLLGGLRVGTKNRTFILVVSPLVTFARDSIDASPCTRSSN